MENQSIDEMTATIESTVNIVVDIAEFLYCRFSIESNLAVNTISWSDKCAMASSFSLSRSLIDWFSTSNSSTLLCMSAPCLSNQRPRPF
jgi:hypothetical protein